MSNSYGNYIDAARDPRRQPPVQSEGVSTHTNQSDHADASSALLASSSPFREPFTDDTPIPSTPDQLKDLQALAPPATSNSPGPNLTAADAVALMRKVPVRTASSPVKKGSSDKKPQKKPVSQHSRLVISEKNTDSGQQDHPMPQRLRSLHMDTQLRDSELEVQCVRGEGSVLVRHHQEKNLQDTQLSTTKVRIPDQKFPIDWCWNKLCKISRRPMKWVEDLDGFEIPLDGDEKMIIPAEAISSISYNIDCQKFYLGPKPNISAEKRLEELVLRVGGDENMPFKLRSIFEQRFGAVRVTRCDRDFFAAKERTFQNHNLFSVPARSTSQGDVLSKHSSDGLDDEVVDDLNSLDALTASIKPAVRASNLLGANSKSQQENSQAGHASDGLGHSPDVVQESIKLVKRKVDKSKHLAGTKGKRKLTPAPGSQRSDVLIIVKQATLQCPTEEKQFAKGDSDKQNGKSDAQVMQAVVVSHANPPTAGVTPTPNSGEDGNEKRQETGPMSPTINIGIGMYFRSGERIGINDLVVRVRDDKSMAAGNTKFDKHDIYDGPFRVLEIPGPIEIIEPSTGREPDESKSGCFASKLDEAQLAAMRQKTVKLHIPKGSLADPWTKLGRLRPVYHVYPEVPDDLEARDWYYWPKFHNQERRIMNTEDMGAEADDEVLNTRGVCHMQKGFYTKVQYVATGGLESDNTYEVEKLRDKIIERLPRKEFPDELMDDPNIVRYLEEEGGVLEKSEVLVVKYLVHWAGWPSEDDTYERAQENIPQSFIDAYEAVAGTYADVPEPARKRRKSQVKRYLR